MVTTADRVNLATDVYNDSGAPAGWIRLENRPDPNTGFFGAVYQNAAGDIVAAIRGMNPFSPNDVQAVEQVKLGQKPDQFDSGLSFYEYVQANFGGNVSYTGHSLGGAIVAYIISKGQEKVSGTIVWGSDITCGACMGRPLRAVSADIVYHVSNLECGLRVLLLREAV